MAQHIAIIQHKDNPSLTVGYLLKYTPMVSQVVLLKVSSLIKAYEQVFKSPWVNIHISKHLYGVRKFCFSCKAVIEESIVILLTFYTHFAIIALLQSRLMNEVGHHIYIFSHKTLFRHLIDMKSRRSTKVLLILINGYWNVCSFKCDLDGHIWREVLNLLLHYCWCSHCGSLWNCTLNLLNDCALCDVLVFKL